MRKPLELLDGLTGSIIPTFNSTAPVGWKLLNGETIGSTGSTATHKGDALRALYLVLWAVASVVVTGGKGASAAADWTANKNLALPDVRGRAIIGAGAGGSLTARTLGESGGAEAHTLDVTQIPSHSHLAGSTSSTSQNGTQGNAPRAFSGAPVTYASEAVGGGLAHNNMQPFFALNYLVKM